MEPISLGRTSLMYLHVFDLIKFSTFDNSVAQDKLPLHGLSVAHRRHAKAFIAMLQSSCRPDH